MKRIFSFFMAVMLLVSAVPVAYAAETETSTETSNIEMVGKYSAATYEVTVPSKLAPGETGTVTATGAWASNQTLTVTCPNSVTLSYDNQTIDVGVTFAGINQVGDDLNEMNVSADVTVANATAMFGTWTGVLEYTVSCSTDTADLLYFVINDVDYVYDDWMTWAEWIKSDYNTIGLFVGDDNIIYDSNKNKIIALGNRVNVSASDLVEEDNMYGVMPQMITLVNGEESTEVSCYFSTDDDRGGWIVCEYQGIGTVVEWELTGDAIGDSYHLDNDFDNGTYIAFAFDSLSHIITVNAIVEQ